jgi:hypothetical protein
MTNYSNRNYLDWLVGFSEGDGSWFIRSNKSVGFEITQHNVDSQVLYEIRSFLGFGSVYHDTSQPRCRYSLTKGHYQEVINIFNNRLKCDYRFDQFQKWCSFIHLEIDPSIAINQISKDTTEIKLDNAWLSGFIDAEGCFRIAIDRNRPKLVFEITQKEIEPLKQIARLLSLKQNIRLDRGVYVLASSSKQARDTLIQYIDKYPLKTKKRISYMNWKEAHMLDKTDPNYMEKALILKANISDNVKNISIND